MTSSRTRSRSDAGRANSRGPSSSGGDNSQMIVMVGAAAIAIVVVLVIMMRGGDDDSGDAKADKSTPPVTSTPEVSPPKPASPGVAKTGKTPTRAAPELSHETLGKLDQLLAEAKTHYNEGVTARQAGDNTGAREAQAKAKVLLDQWEQLIAKPLAWQEEADMEGWAQPAEYEILTSKYSAFSSLQNMVRKNGGM